MKKFDTNVLIAVARKVRVSNACEGIYQDRLVRGLAIDTAGAAEILVTLLK